MAKRGLTLIELIIVIAIIGILAGLGFTNYVTSQKRARDGKRKADMEQIRSALEMCRADTGSYPSGGCGATTLDCGDGTSYTIPNVDCSRTGSYCLSFTEEATGEVYTVCNP